MKAKTTLDRIFESEPAPFRLPLLIHNVTMLLRSNDPAVIAALRRIYAPYVVDLKEPPAYEICALDLDPSRYIPAERSGVQNYEAANGKAKHPFWDEGTIRYSLHVATGMVVIFDEHRYAILGNLNEIIDQLRGIINGVQIQEMEARGYTIVHASAAVLDGVGVALTGRAGGGKSTTMLKLVAAGGAYVSNNRLIMRREPVGGWFEMRGVVKWPRVCAGTMYGDPQLRAQLPAEAVARYERMSFDELYTLNEKYDVDVDAAYGPGRVMDYARFRRLYCLMWSRQGVGFGIERVDLNDDSFWDDFGPTLARDAGALNRQQLSSSWNDEKKRRIRQGLAGLEVFAITGKLNFDRIADALREHLKQTY